LHLAQDELVVEESAPLPARRAVGR
jgi:hypothetical protein